VCRHRDVIEPDAATSHAIVFVVAAEGGPWEHPERACGGYEVEGDETQEKDEEEYFCSVLFCFLLLHILLNRPFYEETNF